MFPVPAHGKGKIHAQVWDITSKPPARSVSPVADLANLSLNENAVEPAETQPPSSPPASAPSQSFSLPFGLKPNSVDVLTVIYVLSALHPTEWEQAIHNLFTVSCYSFQLCFSQSPLSQSTLCLDHNHTMAKHSYQALKPGGILLVRDYGRNDLAQIRIKKDRLIDPSVPNFYIRGDGTRVYFFEKEQLKELLETSPRGEEGKEMFEITQLGEDKRMVSWLVYRQWCGGG
jgi:tRNAThr (cytosine32-N3)-methyltransferase